MRPLLAFAALIVLSLTLGTPAVAQERITFPSLDADLATAPSGTAHAGQNPAARADAIVRVSEFLRRYLGG